jgi:hypothetical protein
MLKREALIESLSSNLNDFLRKTGENLSFPQSLSANFCGGFIRGLLFKGRFFV